MNKAINWPYFLVQNQSGQKRMRICIRFTENTFFFFSKTLWKWRKCARSEALCVPAVHPSILQRRHWHRFINLFIYCFILVVSMLNLIFVNPSKSLIRSACTSVFMASWELESKDVPLPIGDYFNSLRSTKIKQIFDPRSLIFILNLILDPSSLILDP